MDLRLPHLSLIALVGASGSGKSTFARKHFLPTEVISSDYCRALVADDENNLAATDDAFEILHAIAAKRLTAGRLTVVDATNVRRDDRAPLIDLARRFHVVPVAIVFNLPELVCLERNAVRTDRSLPPRVVANQRRALRRDIANLKREGFRYVFEFRSQDETDAAAITREPTWTDRRQETGPFDIIGDIHGCFDELLELLTKLGWQIEEPGDGASTFRLHHAAARKLIFLGDLCDRGPASPAVLRLAMDAVAQGMALCVPGNHDVKLARKLAGRNVQVAHGLALTLEQLAAEPPEFSHRVAEFLNSLISHYILDDGRLVVAHGGMKAEMQGRASRAVRDFALYGETTGETDEFGLPVRFNWAAEYRGDATVVYGHTPVPEPQWLNRTINIDTGCVFGGRLTALRWPERELISVPARRVYAEPARPLAPPPIEAAAAGAADDVLDIGDLLGKRLIHTRLGRTIILNEGETAAAIEVMSRFAANPRWLIYLPPTMSPCETSREEGLLEHPREAFIYYRDQGVPRVICQEKHMGSRAVVIVCRNEGVAAKRFGVTGEGAGIIYTRTGRRFFDDPSREAELLARLRTALDAAGFWSEFDTDWICLDCELMPWSAKAQGLLQDQYAAVAAAAEIALPEAVECLAAAGARGIDTSAIRPRYETRAALISKYVAAYREYCWPVESVNDLKLAPFHILATERRTYFDRDHQWHMDTIARICASDAGVLHATPYRLVDLADIASEQSAIDWWTNLTNASGEGMVVKPLEFIARNPTGVVQPAVKCRGPEYLRIIYGPEYSLPENLARLRRRGRGAKRALAIREFTLGVESLERFVADEPLHRVHECTLAVLALESEPVDPRL